MATVHCRVGQSSGDRSGRGGTSRIPRRAQRGRGRQMDARVAGEVDRQQVLKFSVLGLESPGEGLLREGGREGELETEGTGRWAPRHRPH